MNRSSPVATAIVFMSGVIVAFLLESAMMKPTSQIPRTAKAKCSQEECPGSKELITRKSKTTRRLRRRE